MTGTIKKMTSRGFGFIETASEIDYFFHYTDYDGDWKALLGKFAKGVLIYVTFEIDQENHQGPRATRVVVTEVSSGPINDG